MFIISLNGTNEVINNGSSHTWKLKDSWYTFLPSISLAIRSLTESSHVNLVKFLLLLHKSISLYFLSHFSQLLQVTELSLLGYLLLSVSSFLQSLVWQSLLEHWFQTLERKGWYISPLQRDHKVLSLNYQGTFHFQLY